MKVKMIETVLHDGQRFEAEEVRSVDAEVGAYFCEMGWAEDVDGAVPTGKRDIHKVKILDIESGVHGHTASEVK